MLGFITFQHQPTWQKSFGFVGSAAKKKLAFFVLFGDFRGRKSVHSSHQLKQN
jgi:hypothetical protein